ncbi:unnamed protein product, partial [Closterium sp. NIES-53]
AFVYDVHRIYVLISSKDVTLSSGFYSQYCGWHTVEYTGSSPLYYALWVTTPSAPTRAA